MAQGAGGDATRKWQGLLQAWRRSGHSQSEFCRRQGVSLSTFNYRKRRLERAEAAAGKAATTSSFVPVRVLDQAVPGVVQHIEVRLSNGRRLRCRADLPGEVLRRLATALEADGAPC